MKNSYLKSEQELYTEVEIAKEIYVGSLNRYNAIYGLELRRILPAQGNNSVRLYEEYKDSGAPPVSFGSRIPYQKALFFYSRKIRKKLIHMDIVFDEDRHIEEIREHYEA